MHVVEFLFDKIAWLQATTYQTKNSTTDTFLEVLPLERLFPLALLMDGVNLILTSKAVALKVHLVALSLDFIRLTAK